MIEYIGQKLGGQTDGEISNAYLHAMFTALNTIGLGSSLAKEFADAHENRPDNDVAQVDGEGRVNLEYFKMGIQIVGIYFLRKMGLIRKMFL